MVLMVLLVGIPLLAENLTEKLNRRVSPNFVNASIRDILRAFARQYDLNIVIGKDVTGTVTLQLKNVTLQDALDVLLKSQGYRYIVDNEVILVKGPTSIASDELSTRVIRLVYLDGYQLQKTLQPLLSERGQIEALVLEKGDGDSEPRSDALVVTDLRENVENIVAVVNQLDVPSPQLQIEVRLVETVLDDEKRVGLKLPTSIQVSATGAEQSKDETSSESSISQGNPLAATYEPPDPNRRINLGILTLSELQAALEALDKDQNSRLISSPRVTTLNNRRALIKIGTVVPVQEISRGVGGDLISFREKEVNLNLEVIPRINRDRQITLTVHPILEEIIGFTGPPDAPQPITSKREVETTVTVQDGETVVIGGLIKETENKTVEKVWLLGDIPLLGYLFRHTTTKKQKTDLLIFITPKIITQE